MTTPESETLQQIWYALVQEFRASGLQRAPMVSAARVVLLFL
ncbi:MAG: hypothetical protein ACYCOU_14380 [Sulfobacillus sp.]